jgi:hypothetical protein
MGASTVLERRGAEIAIGTATKNAQAAPTVDGGACAALIDSRAGEG